MIQVRDLEKSYYSRSFSKQPFKAVDGVSFRIAPGETLGLAGESGCGKSTLGRMMVGLIPPETGQILYRGQDFLAATPGERKALRRRMQIVFQSPRTALNPRMTIRESVCEPLRIHGLCRGGAEERQRALELLDMVGLEEEHLYRYPRELSGGQVQRVALARVLSLQPDFIVADEPTSMLDVSVQAQILRLFQDIKEKQAFACLFISHDLDVIAAMSDRIAVMYRGQIVEIGPARDIINNPRHPYTRMLVSLFSNQAGGIETGGGDRAESALESGCRYYARCPLAGDECRQAPELLEYAPGHLAACARL